MPKLPFWEKIGKLGNFFLSLKNQNPNFFCYFDTVFLNERFMLDEMLQILQYFWNMKTNTVFFIYATLFIPLDYACPVSTLF